MIAQKCPVCNGRTEVPEQLYDGLTTRSDYKMTTCKSCQGKGYVVIEAPRPPALPSLGPLPELPPWEKGRHDPSLYSTGVVTRPVGDTTYTIII